MQQIGGSTYSLVGLDTNIFSEVLRDRRGARDGFMSLFAGGKHVICFSIYSLFELRRRKEIYEQFLEFFDVFPCAVLKNEDQLFKDEVKMYSDMQGIDPLLLGFSVINRNRGTNLRNVLEVVFSEQRTIEREREWPALKRDILDAWLQLKPNFKSKGHKYVPSDGVEFVESVALSQSAQRDFAFYKKCLETDRGVKTSAFPSLRMAAWTVFFRVYCADRRTPTTQDVFDTLISTPAPYLDAAVTENFQADIYQQVARLDSVVSNLKVYTLRDLTS